MFVGTGNRLSDSAFEPLTALSELRTLSPHVAATAAQLSSLSGLPLTRLDLDECTRLHAEALRYISSSLLPVKNGGA